MIIKDTLKEISREKPLPARGLDPAILGLVSSSSGIRFLLEIALLLMLASTIMDQAEVTEITAAFTCNINCLTYSP